jgi:hypothetical protein
MSNEAIHVKQFNTLVQVIIGIDRQTAGLGVHGLTGTILL